MSFIIRMCVFCLTARGDRDLYLYLKKIGVSENDIQSDISNHKCYQIRETRNRRESVAPAPK